MKLFQRLLVAPAALGLLAPLAANADITNVSEDASYEVIQARVDGVEAQLGEIKAGAFSSTTTTWTTQRRDVRDDTTSEKCALTNCCYYYFQP